MCNKIKEFTTSFKFRHPLTQKFVRRIFKMQEEEFDLKVWVWRKMFISDH